MPKPTNEMKAIDPGDRQIAKIHTAPCRMLFSDGVADGEVLQLDTDRPLGTGFYLYRMAPGTTTQAYSHSGHEEFLMLEGDFVDHESPATALATLYGCAIAPRMSHIPNQAALSSCLLQISARQTTNNWRLDQLAGVGLRGETSDNPMIMTASDVQTHPEWLSANSTNPQITPAIVTKYPVWLAKIGPAN